MTVVFKQNEARVFTADEVLWSKETLVNAMVERALIGQTEAFIDMITDMQEDTSREAINNTLRGVKESAQDFLADVIGDLQRAVDRRLAAVNYGAAVTGLKFDLAGDVVDIEVDVSISVE